MEVLRKGKLQDVKDLDRKVSRVCRRHEPELLLFISYIIQNLKWHVLSPDSSRNQTDNEEPSG